MLEHRRGAVEWAFVHRRWHADSLLPHKLLGRTGPDLGLIR